MDNKKEWDLLKELNSYCFICKKRIELMCGQPEIKVGGCCVGYWFKKKRWITARYAHIHCYLKKRPTKLLEKENTTLKFLIQIFKRRLEHTISLLREEKLCKGSWRKEEQINKRKYQRLLYSLNRLRRNRL